MPLAYLISLFFFCVVIPIGFYVLVKTYRLGKKIFNPHIIFELPFKDSEGDFVIEKAGRYSIWQKGKLFSQSPVDKIRPQIVDLETGKIVPRYGSILRPHINGSSSGSMELFNLKLEKGSYRLQIVDGSSISKSESIISAPIAAIAPGFDPDKFSFFVRKRMNPLYILGFVWLIFLCIALIVGGFIMGLVADKIFGL